MWCDFMANKCNYEIDSIITFFDRCEHLFLILHENHLEVARVVEGSASG
jgi:hypothetical protein